LKSLGTDKILAKHIKAGGKTLCSETHKLIRAMWNKEELLQQWRESIILPVHKKVDKTDCNTLLLKSGLYGDEIIGDWLGGF
jgi:hypothetical protein